MRWEKTNSNTIQKNQQSSWLAVNQTSEQMATIARDGTTIQGQSMSPAGVANQKIWYKLLLVLYVYHVTLLVVVLYIVRTSATSRTPTEKDTLFI